MLLQIKMYVRFVVWLLKRSLGIFSFIPDYFSEWKDSVRDEFGMSVLMWILPMLVSTLVSIIFFLISNGTDIKPPASVFLHPVYGTTGMYVGVIIAALYDAFIEDYERSFTILKKD